MAKHRKVNPQRWNDPRVRALSKPEPNGLTLYWFLRTGPQTRIIPGLYEARAGGLADYLGWSLEGFGEAFGEALAQGLAKADWDAGLVWVPDAIEDDHPQSTNAAIAWGTAWTELPDCELKTESYRYVLAFLEGIRQGLAQAFAKACAIQITDNRYQTPDPRSQTQRGASAVSKKPASEKGQVPEPKPKRPSPDPDRLAAARKKANTKKAGGGGKQPSLDTSPSTPALFGCDQSTRDGLIATLEGRKGKKKRGRLEKWIQEEVVRVFKTERKRATGDGYVKLGPQGERAALDVGTACIGHGITPERLIEFWLDPDNNFTNMKFPTLTFLGNEKNLERAAATVKPGRRGGAGRKRAAGRGHGYDDTSELDPRVRSVLAEHGYPVAEMTDRQLLTVQNAAKELAAGRAPGMSQKLRAMAVRAKGLFKGG